MSKRSARSLLRDLAALKASYGGTAAQDKIQILKQLDRASMPSPRFVSDLHEILCFLRAYPDDEAVLALVEAMLARFAERRDLRRSARSLVSSGIAGARIDYPFFWPTARWLAGRWPELLKLNWPEVERPQAMRSEILLGLPIAMKALAKHPKHPNLKQMLASLCRNGSEAALLIELFEAIPGDDFVRESLYDRLDVELSLEPGPDTPSRTRAKLHSSPVVFISQPPSRSRPDLKLEARRAPKAVREASGREALAIIDLAKEAMVTRSRDLDVFAYPNHKDVRVIDDSDGLQFACIGTEPSRRLLLPAAYGFLTLRNGVPIGYIQADILLGSAEISFNTFETFRGGEAALTFARFLAVLKHELGATSFTIEPYQLGLHNDEALSSGAWWFYYKLGFRPEDSATEALVRSELAKMRRDPKHRSSRPTLKKLASRYLMFDLGRRGLRPPINLLAVDVARALVTLGLDRDRGMEEAMLRLGLEDLRGFSVAEREALARFAPIIAGAKSARAWSKRAQSAVLRTIKAKSARRESDYLQSMQKSPELARALSSLAALGRRDRT